ncbi:MAG TPA: RodZ domain-containing protein [Rhodanobacteraceae bacterium]
MPEASLETRNPPLNIHLGQQLREAREARHLDIVDCGQILRLPVRVLKKLEAGDYTGISEAVYLRNYLTSYGACVGLQGDLIHDAVEQLAPPEKKPALVSTGGIPRTHYLWHKYTTAIAAVVLTAFVVVPLVWLGLKGGLDRELTRLQPLDSAPVSQPQSALASVPRGSAGVAHVKSAVRADKPLMASMAPFSAMDSVDEEMATPPARPTPPPVPPVTATASDSHTLSLDLTQPSWVEIVTASGQRLQYSLLPAGAHKVYHSDQPFRVSIGDASGTNVQLDGKTVDLDTYRHANVAHFRVALKDGRAVVKPGLPG